MSKEEFIEILNSIDEFLKWEYSVDNALGAVIEVPDLISPIITLLDREFNVEEDDLVGGDISYFIYDLDFGRNYKPGMVTDKDDNDIDFSSAEKLYDYLMETKNA